MNNINNSPCHNIKFCVAAAGFGVLAGVVLFGLGVINHNFALELIGAMTAFGAVMSLALKRSQDISSTENMESKTKSYTIPKSGRVCIIQGGPSYFPNPSEYKVIADPTILNGHAQYGYRRQDNSDL